MRSIEKFIMVVAVVVFITAMGMGVFSIYVQGFKEGLTMLEELFEHSTNLIIAGAALITAALTLNSSKRGRKKRGR